MPWSAVAGGDLAVPAPRTHLIARRSL